MTDEIINEEVDPILNGKVNTMSALQNIICPNCGTDNCHCPTTAYNYTLHQIICNQCGLSSPAMKSVDEAIQAFKAITITHPPQVISFVNTDSTPYFSVEASYDKGKLRISSSSQVFNLNNAEIERLKQYLNNLNLKLQKVNQP